MGDGIQAAKAGILEIADVFVVNKADRDGADETVRELRQMLALGAPPEPGRWRAPVLSLVAIRGEGLEDLMAAVARHQEWGSSSGAARRRRLLRVEGEVESIAVEELRRRHVGAAGGRALREAAERVLDGSTDPWTAAEALVPRQP